MQLKGYAAEYLRMMPVLQYQTEWVNNVKHCSQDLKNSIFVEFNMNSFVELFSTLKRQEGCWPLGKDSEKNGQRKFFVQ